MGKRPANREGTVRERSDGRFEGRLSYVDPDTGERKRVSVYADSRKAALDKLDEIQDRLEAGAPPKEATRTVGQWLAHWQVTTLAASDRKASTKELYANLSRKHLETGPLSATRLDRLRPSNVEKLILDMRAQTKPGQPTDDDPNPEPVRTYSDSTIRSTYAVLRSALDGAVRDGLLARNPAALVKRPGVERTEAKHLDGDDVTRLPRAGVPHLVFTDVVQKYYAEVDKGDVDEVVALFEVDAEYSRPGYAHMSGREAIRSFYVDDRIIESGVHNIESIVSDSGTVAVEGSFKGTVRGGANAEVKFADFFWPGPNGLIKKRRTYFYAPLV